MAGNTMTEAVSDLFDPVEAASWRRRLERLARKLDPNDRIVFSKGRGPLVPEPVEQGKPGDDLLKPKGLWYSFGDAWFRWCTEEGVDWSDGWKRVLRLTVQANRLLRITSEREFLEFEETRPKPDVCPTMFTEWGKVAEGYAGIEINPYLWKYRLTHAWYYPWDVASGTIWDPNAILGVETLLERSARTATRSRGAVVEQGEPCS